VWEPCLDGRAPRKVLLVHSLHKGRKTGKPERGCRHFLMSRLLQRDMPELTRPFCARNGSLARLATAILTLASALIYSALQLPCLTFYSKYSLLPHSLGPPPPPQKGGKCGTFPPHTYQRMTRNPHISAHKVGWWRRESRRTVREYGGPWPPGTGFPLICVCAATLSGRIRAPNNAGKLNTGCRSQNFRGIAGGA
jgi:hypothetical protein